MTSSMETRYLFACARVDAGGRAGSRGRKHRAIASTYKGRNDDGVQVTAEIVTARKG